MHSNRLFFNVYDGQPVRIQLFKMFSSNSKNDNPIERMKSMYDELKTKLNFAQLLIQNDKQLCAHVVQVLQSWLLFEQHEEQIKRKQELIVHARTFVEKYETYRISFFRSKLCCFVHRGLEICQLKTDIESNFTSVEQAILEMPVEIRKRKDNL